MFLKTVPFVFGILNIPLFIIFFFPGISIAQNGMPVMLDDDTQAEFERGDFIVYGKANTGDLAGIETNASVKYKKIADIDNFPTDFETFFEISGTLELLTKITPTNLTPLRRGDIIISEIMWGVDTKYPLEKETHSQWIELYNPTGEEISVGEGRLYLLFSKLESYPDRDIVSYNGSNYRVLDAVSNLHRGYWEFPGKSGASSTTSSGTSVLSAYRKIIYPARSNQRAVVPYGSYESSWEETPTRGRRNILFVGTLGGSDERIIPYFATPGAPHVPDVFIESLQTTAVSSNRIVINEVRNDISVNDIDWIEIKNVTRSTEIDLTGWELSIVTGVGKDTDIVSLPAYILAAGEILLIQRKHPQLTELADGLDIIDFVRPTRGAIHRFFVEPNLSIPNTGRFTLLLRNESNKNGIDAAIEDYAGDGFFTDPSNAFSTNFWPRVGQSRPIDIADFGSTATFGSLQYAWARVRYNQSDDGHHKDAWAKVGPQGGLGYAPGVELSIAPGTPGYENTAIKTRLDDNNFRTPLTDAEYVEGALSISEIMSDPGERQNEAQWIEIYNASLTEAVNLEGWILEVRNLADNVNVYAKGTLTFNETIILPNQTLLLVSRNAPNNVSENRIYDLYQYHRRELMMGRRGTLLLNPNGFYLRLSDKGDPKRAIASRVVDVAGNLSSAGGHTQLWEFPTRDPERRQSLLRQYGRPFRPEKHDSDGVPDPAGFGTSATAWLQSNARGISFTSITYYGNRNDVGTPGYRLGSPLPVTLASFRTTRDKHTGYVIVRWRTTSEVDNAGFNILRSKYRNGQFVVINPRLILGAGTSSEQHTYHFTDTTAVPSTVYYYQIEDVSFAGVRQTLATTRLKGDISVFEKLITRWGSVKD
jgi:hypothetical protein